MNQDRSASTLSYHVPKQSHGGKMNQQILLIDDDKRIHALVRTLLADEPVEIQSALDPEYGLTLAESLRPDLILLDVEMPHIDGYEVCRRLKVNPDLFNIPVIFLTALSTVHEKIHGLELGAADYVTKPFNSSELLARVRASLRTRHIVRMLEEKALIDFLTGLGNRAMFKQRLAAEIAQRVRTGKPLACIVADVDDFQGINDTHGNPFGDRVLQEIGKIISETVRVEDVACRLGGDAFVVLTPNTDTVQACLLAKRMLAALSSLQVNSRGIPISVKASVAVAPSIAIYDADMCERANQAIEQARNQGQEGVAVAYAAPETTKDAA
jgi:diguanylate cyclase (GGDEF)-like protein